MKNRIFFISFIVFLVITNSCNSEISENQMNLNNINVKIIKKFKDRYDLDLSGVGISSPDGIIHELTLMFNLHKHLTKKELRKLIVDCAQSYLKAINDDSSLKKYLCCYPFPITKIQLSIFIYESEFDTFRYPEIGIVENNLGQVEFIYVDPEDDIKYTKIEKESFEEALEKVNSESE